MVNKMMNHQLRQIAAVIGTVLVISVLAGCQHSGIKWEGSTAKQEDNIVLMTGGPHEFIWKTRNIEVNYAYTSEKGIFSIEGTVNVAGHIENGFRTLNNFSVFMNLLNDSKLILDSRLITVAGTGIPIRVFRFKNAFPLPTGATALNFSYSGTASEGGSVRAGSGDDGGASITFWQNP